MQFRHGYSVTRIGTVWNSGLILEVLRYSWEARDVKTKRCGRVFEALAKRSSDLEIYPFHTSR